MRLEREQSNWQRMVLSLDEPISSSGPWRAFDLSPSASGQPSSPATEMSEDLAVLGWRRWTLAMQANFLSRACETALEDQQSNLALAVAGTLAAFCNLPLLVDSKRDYTQVLDQFLYNTFRSPRYVVTPHALSPDRKAVAQQLWSLSVPDGPPLPSDAFDASVRKQFWIKNPGPDIDYDPLVKSAAKTHMILGGASVLSDGTVQVVATGSEGRVEAFKTELTTMLNVASPDLIEEVETLRDNFPLFFFKASDRPELIPILLYVLGPDPLEMLCRGVLRIPDSVT
jgi:acylphosphatase